LAYDLQLNKVNKEYLSSENCLVNKQRRDNGGSILKAIALREKGSFEGLEYVGNKSILLP